MLMDSRMYWYDGTPAHSSQTGLCGPSVWSLSQEEFCKIKEQSSDHGIFAFIKTGESAAE
jgi:hypothetical protein